MELSLATRKRGQLALLAISFLMMSGFFMVIPLISVYYVEDLAFAAGFVGLALAVRQLFQQGFALFGGMLADKFGVRLLIGLGVWVRAAGFVSLGLAKSPWLFLFAMVLSALGGALFEAPSRAAVAAVTTEGERAQFFSLNSIVNALGMTIGPLIGAFLLRFNFETVCFAAAALFAIVSAVVFFLPKLQVSDQSQSFTYGLSLVRHDKTFLIFTALLMGYWFMWVQLTISIPLITNHITGSHEAIGMVYAFNAVLTIIGQYPILRFAERWLRPLPILIIGVLCMALGLGAVALASDLVGLLICIALFTLGMLLAAPTQQTVTVALADQRALGSYFGVNGLALAVGGSIGNLSGGLLTDAARENGLPFLPWLTFALIGLSCVVGLAFLARTLYQRRDQKAQLSEQLV